MMRGRVLAVLGIVVLCSAVATVYALRARRLATLAEHRPTGVVIDAEGLKQVRERPHVLFRSSRLGQGYGLVVAAAGDGPMDTRFQTGLECDRIAAGPAGGVCLTADRGVQTTYWAVIVDANLQPRHRLALSGVPSRARVSPDGRLVGITVFEAGHGYADASFSTRTTLVDTSEGRTVADLEQFEVFRDGRRFTRADFNFWGVTFARDSNTFYATLGTESRLYLVRGDAAARRATVIGEGVECPSLSPDNLRIAFKKRTKEEGRLVWRLAVRELASGVEHVIPGETRSVDDQVEWLDDSRIAYAVGDEESGRGGTSVFAVDVVSAPAVLWADGAYSPSAVSRPNP